MSKFDSLYRKFLLTKFFTKGWGKPEHMRRIMALRRTIAADRDTAVAIANPDAHPVTITREEVKRDHRIVEGHFSSPAQPQLKNLLPPESEKAYFQMVLPRDDFLAGGANRAGRRPLCIQYAGTGDHFFYRRRHLMALPLLRERGVASVLLENPFYGLRKPAAQLRSSLRNVTDMFVMGACLMLESIVLADYCEKCGYDPVVLHGISMGGHMAALSATVMPRPVGVVPCLAWTSASLTFTEGVLADAIPWDLLSKQLIARTEYGDQIQTWVRSEDNKFTPPANFDFTHWDESDDGKGGKTDEEEEEEDSNASAVWQAIRPGPLVREGISPSAIRFMRGIMDECTHLRNFSVPVDPELAIVVLAEKDAYQPRKGITSIPDIWPGSETRFIDNRGHVVSYLTKQDVFRGAIYDVIDKIGEKYSEHKHTL